MTREKAIKTLEVIKCTIAWKFPLYYQLALDMAIEALKQQNREDCISREWLKSAIPPEEGWTPVSEGLPEDGTWNFWQSKDGKISFERYKKDAIDHFYPAGRFFELEDAIAWRPRPEPYVPDINVGKKEEEKG